MGQYLYGAAVQGIQEFIFRTNKLSEITGASELVERICTTFFKEMLGDTYKEEDALVHAAGNVKYKFNNESDCMKAVRNFPMYVISRVPGITISQAVVKYDEEKDCLKDCMLEIEKRLRIERNKAHHPTTLGLMGIERSRHTGLPMVDNIQKWDEATFAKKEVLSGTILSLCEKAFGSKSAQKYFAYETDKMTGENDWIAVIHADGNGLGQVVQSVCESKDGKLKEFSDNLDDANKIAAQRAFNDIVDKFKLKGKIPIRPIVLSGDDFTVICRADFALDYVKLFIRYFEDETREMGYPLTACAGIAYIKSSFPFYYGYELAEELCSAAKEDAKKCVEKQEKAPSCVMFYKVEDSFTESYKEIKKRVLTTNTEHQVSYSYGPYYIHKGQSGRWTVDEIQRQVKEVSGEDKDSNALKSHLRQWLSTRFNDEGMAEQKLKRMKTTLKSKSSIINELTDVAEGRIAAYDVLTLNSITIKTK